MLYLLLLGVRLSHCVKVYLLTYLPRAVIDKNGKLLTGQLDVSLKPVLGALSRAIQLLYYY